MAGKGEEQAQGQGEREEGEQSEESVECCAVGGGTGGNWPLADLIKAAFVAARTIGWALV